MTRRPLLTAGVLLAALPASAAAQGISEFPLPAGSDPTFITTGHDGRLWFPLNGAGQIGRISINGALQQSVASQPNPIDIGPALAGGIVWSTPTTIQLRGATGSTTSHTTNHPSAYAVVATPSNQVLWTQIAPYTPGFYASLGYSDIPFGGSAGTEELVPSSPSSPRLTDITVAPDHKLWFTLYEGAAILKTAASGAVEIRNDLAAGSLPYRIAVGPDGAMWFTEYGANRIGRVTNAGAVTEFDLPRPGVGPNDIVAGPDGALWFTEYNDAGNAIGRITTDGKVTEYPIPTATSKPWGIAAGPDGLIWFTEYGTDKIGRLDPSKAVPIGGGAGGGGGGAGADRTRPAFQGKVTLSRKRFSVGRAPTPFTVARAVPSGTQFRFSLSEPARVTVKIERRLSGRRVRGRCRTGAKSGRRCKLWRSAGRSLTRQGLQGPNSIAFSGRLGRRALPIGNYRARLTATDAVGNRSRTVTLGFGIVAKGR